MSGWKTIKEKKKLTIESIESIVDYYNYSDKHAAQLTDEKICEFLTNRIRECKEIIFEMIQLGFEAHKQALENDLVKIRDELDIFSDEIKMRVFKWDEGIPEEWLERLVSHDFEILKASKRICENLKSVYHRFLEAEGELKLFDEDEWRRMKNRIEEIYHDIENLAILFKERDVICNIRKIALERTFEEIRKRLRK